jgi:hypothetical protein
MAMVFIGLMLFRQAAIGFDPLSSSRATGRSLYLEIHLPWKPVSVHSERVIRPLTQQIAQIPGVSPVLSAVQNDRILMAAALGARVKQESVASQIRILAERLIADPLNDVEDFSKIFVVSKSIHQPLLGTVTLGRFGWVGFSDFDNVQHEFRQLFEGPRPEDWRYNAAGGLLNLLPHDFEISVAKLGNPPPQQSTVHLAFERLAALLRLVPGVQAALVKSHALRTVELSYSGAELLHLGQTGYGIARSLGFFEGRGQSGADRLPPQLSVFGLHALGDGATLKLNRILEAPFLAKGVSQVRLGDVAKVRSGYRLVSGELGSDPASWQDGLVSDSVHSRFKEEGTGATETIGVILTDETNREKITDAVAAGLGQLSGEFPHLEFLVKVPGEDSHFWGYSWLLWATFVLAVVAPLLPPQLNGVAVLRIFGVGSFLFVALASLLRHQDRLHWNLTALGLILMVALCSALPVARGRLGAVRRVLKSEQIPRFVLFLSLPFVLLLIMLRDHLGPNESGHLLSFMLAVTAVTISSILNGSSATPSAMGSEVPEISLGQGRAWLPVFILLAAVPVFGQRIFAIQPVSSIAIGHIDLSEMGGGVSSLRWLSHFESKFRNRGGFSDSEMSFGVAAPRLDRVTQLRAVAGATGVDTDFIRDVILSQSPVVARTLVEVTSQASNTKDLVAVRLVDKDLMDGSNGYLSQSWIDQASVPLASIVRSGHGRREEAKGDEIIALREILETEIKSAPVLDLRMKGNPVLLFGEVGREVGPNTASKVTEHFENNVRRMMVGEGLPASDVHLKTNLSLRSEEQKQSSQLFWVFAFLALVAGALFFGSFKGALQTSFAFMISWGVVKPVLIFTYTFSGTLDQVSYLEIQIATFALSVGALSIWGHIAADTNESRKANLPLDATFSPFLFDSSHLCKVLCASWSVALVLGLTYVPFRFLGALMLIAAGAMFLFPRWVYLCSDLDEVGHRIILRIQIKAQAAFFGGSFQSSSGTRGQTPPRVRGAMLFLFMGIGGSFFGNGFGAIAFADEVRDTSCHESSFVVLPFMNLPQSIEDIVVNAQVSDVLSSRLPCAVLASDFTGEISEILARHRPGAFGVSELGTALDSLKTYVAENRKRLLASVPMSRVSGLESESRQLSAHILVGFVEEVYGFIGLSIVHVSPVGAAEIHKFLFRASEIGMMSDRVSQTVTLDDAEILDRLNKNSSLIPVRVELVHSGKSPPGGDSARLRQTVFDVLSNRFAQPPKPAFLERRPFFRLVYSGEEPRYSLRVTVEQVGHRVFGAVRADDGSRERTFWAEDDLTNLVSFQERLNKASRSVLASLEGLYDYSILVGPSALLSRGELVARLAMVMFRQNLGSLGVSARARFGSYDDQSASSRGAVSVVLAGAGIGWQFLDSAHLSVELGLGADGGLVQPAKQGDIVGVAADPNIYVSGSAFAQIFLPFSSGWTLGLRLSMEQPYEFQTGATAAEVLKPAVADLFFGIGYSF